MEDKEGWHGKAPNKMEYEQALGELGEVDVNARGTIAMPEKLPLSATLTSGAQAFSGYPIEKTCRHAPRIRQCTRAPREQRPACRRLGR